MGEPDGTGAGRGWLKAGKKPCPRTVRREVVSRARSVYSRCGLDTPTGGRYSAACRHSAPAYNSGFDYVKYEVFDIVGIISRE